MERPKSDTLIRTKLHPPFTRLELVPRPRLEEQLAQGLQGPLTLITAPAGFGKTTLIASYIAGCGLPVAWLSLDKNDNQAGRFLIYLVAALQELDLGLGSEAAQLLAAAQQVPPEVILTSLINDLDAVAVEMALVLDDYQFVHSQVVHEQVAFLLAHCPITFHMVIATRSDPPLPLARLRVRGQAIELRTTDLAFNAGEAAQFLIEVMGLDLDAGSVATLQERTEGWIAGLQMAALSMRDRHDIQGFIKGFSGTNRYILDYLLEEVLTSQPPEIQCFLLYTSILERLTSPLCDAVLADDQELEWKGNDRSPRSGSLLLGGSAATLAYLERANLLLVPLDDERIWYRYHHLFADLLRARLDHLYPQLPSQLHARAAAWLEREGMLVEAINHALAAGAHDRAARLVEKNTARLLAQGELNAMMGWIEALPAKLRLARPWLCIHQAYALRLAGRSAEVGPLLVQAEAALAAASAPDTTSLTDQAEKPAPSPVAMTEARALRGAVAAVRAFTDVVVGQDVEAISLAQHARELLPAEDLWNRSSATWALGFALHSQGHLSAAHAAFAEMVQLGEAMGNIWTLVTGLTDLGRVLRDQGKLGQARVVMEKALAQASQKGARNLGFIARTEEHLATVLYEINEVDAAQQMLSDALTHTHLWPNPNYIVMAHAYLARVRLAQGDRQGARVAIGEADQIKKSSRLTSWLRRTVELELVRVWLALQAAGVSFISGDPLPGQAAGLVTSWRTELATLPERDNSPMDECTEATMLTVARVSLAAGRAAEALSILEPFTRRVQAAGHISAAIRSLVLTAAAWQAGPDGLAPGTRERAPALLALEEALVLAEPGGYVRVFLDEGPPMQTLLAQWLAHAGMNPLRDYAIHLLSQFDVAAQGVTTAQEKAFAGDLVERLTQRELEVLHLIALGTTNAEIAQELVVSTGTVKAHTARIYRKLDVANRTEAVARARQLGILP